MSIDWSSSIQAPLGAHPPELLKDFHQGRFTSAVGTKLTLSNWVTPDIVRYAELLQHLGPKACTHTYFTSGRDEVVDKGLRCLRFNRPKADIVIGLRDQYVGHTTAAARSLSEPIGDPKRFSWFDWPKVEHNIDAVTAAIEQYGKNRILGVVVELIGEKTAYVADNEFLTQLSQLNIPLIFVETASALGRNGQTLFMSDSLPVKPNMVWWYTGAQLGHVFVDDQHYVSKPLTLISTWDGDEISIRRTYRHLIVARECLVKGTALKFHNACREVISLPMSGQGLWQAIEFPLKPIGLKHASWHTGMN